jgi:hypothetical protein
LQTPDYWTFDYFFYNASKRALQARFEASFRALCKRLRYKVFVESRTERGSQQKLWFYLSAKRCIWVSILSETLTPSAFQKKSARFSQKSST